MYLNFKDLKKVMKSVFLLWQDGFPKTFSQLTYEKINNFFFEIAKFINFETIVKVVLGLKFLRKKKRIKYKCKLILYKFLFYDYDC